MRVSSPRLLGPPLQAQIGLQVEVTLGPEGDPAVVSVHSNRHNYALGDPKASGTVAGMCVGRGWDGKLITTFHSE
jgi:hypothetical protein